MLACHYIQNHRAEIVDFINDIVLSPYTLECINSVSDQLTVTSLAFNVTGPLEQENQFFRCHNFRVTRSSSGSAQHSDLVHTDLALEYRNQVSLAMEGVRGSAAAAPEASPGLFTRLNPANWRAPIKAVLHGHADGVAKVRLTMQSLSLIHI